MQGLVERRGTYGGGGGGGLQQHVLLVNRCCWEWQLKGGLDALGLRPGQRSSSARRLAEGWGSIAAPALDAATPLPAATECRLGPASPPPPRWPSSLSSGVRLHLPSSSWRQVPTHPILLGSAGPPCLSANLLRLLLPPGAGGGVEPRVQLLPHKQGPRPLLGIQLQSPQLLQALQEQGVLAGTSLGLRSAAAAAVRCDEGWATGVAFSATAAAGAGAGGVGGRRQGRDADAGGVGHCDGGAGGRTASKVLPVLCICLQFDGATGVGKWAPGVRQGGGNKSRTCQQASRPAGSRGAREGVCSQAARSAESGAVVPLPCVPPSPPPAGTSHSRSHASHARVRLLLPTPATSLPPPSLTPRWPAALPYPTHFIYTPQHARVRLLLATPATSLPPPSLPPR